MRRRPIPLVAESAPLPGDGIALRNTAMYGGFADIRALVSAEDAVRFNRSNLNTWSQHHVNNIFATNLLNGRRVYIDLGPRKPALREPDPDG